jgi:hypothetical protein
MSTKHYAPIASIFLKNSDYGSEEYLDFLKSYFYMEIEGLFHDIGKYTEDFVDYRQNWMTQKEGYKKDPHERFLENEIDGWSDSVKKDPFFHLATTLSKKEFQPFRFFPSEKPYNYRIADDINFNHKRSGKEIDLNNRCPFLHIADAFDAAYDRDNPLFRGEQTEGKTYLSTPFGHETPVRISSKFDPNETLDSYFSTLDCLIDSMRPHSNASFSDALNAFCNSRQNLLDYLEKHFKQTISDSTRPCNDISLWQHSYSVSIFAKILYLSYVLQKRASDDQKLDLKDPLLDRHFPKFTFFGISWDSEKFLTQSSAIKDVIARKYILDQLYQQVRNYMEVETMLGSLVYKDESRMVFVIPPLLPGNKEEESVENYIEKTVKSSIATLFNKHFQGEVFPVFNTYVNKDKNTPNATKKVVSNYVEIVNTLEELRIKDKTQFEGQWKPQWIEDWNNIGNGDVQENTTAKKQEICSVCGLRPAVKESDKTVWTTERICETCKERRKLARLKSSNGKDSKQNPVQTVYMEEIGDNNRNVCLLVATMNLLPWISGDAFWSSKLKTISAIEQSYLDLGSIETASEKRNEILIKNDLQSFFSSHSFSYESINEAFTNEKTRDPFARLLSTRYSGNFQSLTRGHDNLKKEYLDKLVLAGKTYKERFGKDVEILDWITSKKPSPGRISNCWYTIGAFFQDMEKRFMNSLSCTKEAIFTYTADTLSPLELPLSQNGSIKICSGVLKRLPSSQSGSTKETPNKNQKDHNNQPSFVDFYIIKEESQNSIEYKFHVFVHENMMNTIDFGEYTLTDIRSDDCKNYSKEVKLSFKGLKTTERKPIRTILCTSNAFMILLPAMAAKKLSQILFQQYQKQFQYVQDRLPLSMGQIFFKSKDPLFASIESGFSMLRNFQENHRSDWENPRQDDHKQIVKSINKFSVHFTNGAKWNIGENPIIQDFYTNIHWIKNSPKLRKTFFPTLTGDTINQSELQPDDSVYIYPAYYDFEHLTSISQRKQIRYFNHKRLLHNTLGNSIIGRPHNLNVFFQLFQDFSALFSHYKAESTKLHHFENLYLQGLKDWNISLQASTKSLPTNFNLYVQVMFYSIFGSPESTLLQDLTVNSINQFTNQGMLVDFLYQHLHIYDEEMKESKTSVY